MSVLADGHTKEAATTQYFLEQGEQALHTMKYFHEKDMLQLQNALLMSRLKHHVPYIRHNKKDKYQVDTIIRQAAKLALGVPINAINTSTQLLTTTHQNRLSACSILVTHPGIEILYVLGLASTATRTVHHTAKNNCACKHCANSQANEPAETCHTL